MDTAAGDLVTVTTAGHAADAIVFEATGGAKVIVATVDPKRGPVMRPVDATSLTSRAGAGPHDRALQALIRRTPHSNGGAAHASSATGAGRAGHRRAAMHRTTGK
jgi:hypothetical protein